MKKLSALSLVFPLFLLILLPYCDAKPEDDLPELTGRVVDLAEIIPPATEERLNNLLQRHEEATTDQIVVLTVDSLEGLPIEDYSIRVVEKWKIGQKGKDNGVLLLVAKSDRKVRIEVGYGLEGDLTDLHSRRIIDQRIVPEFKKGNFAEGITYGVAGILHRLKSPLASDAGNELSGTGTFSGTVTGAQEEASGGTEDYSGSGGLAGNVSEPPATNGTPSTDVASSEESPGSKDEGSFWEDTFSLVLGGIFAIGMGLFALWIVQFFLRAMLFSEGAAGWVFLAAVGWIPGLVGASIATASMDADMGSPTFWAWLALLLGGTVAIRLLFQKTDWGEKLARKWEPDLSSSGTYSGSSYSSSSSGGWSSSSYSGGFSGGGGSFGGGGASGSW